MNLEYTTDGYNLTTNHEFPSLFFQAIIVLTILCLLWTGYVGFKNQTHLNQLLQNEIQAEQLSDAIVHFDEVLTNSARLAILSKDTRWKKRYDKYVKKLDNTLVKVRSSVPKEFNLILHEKTVSNANEQLVQMEIAAFKLASQGQYRKAQELLFSQRYEDYKQKYKQGIDRFSQSVHLLLGQQVHKWQKKLNGELLQLYRDSRNYHLVLNSTGEGIYEVDLSGNARFVNQAACKILGYEEHELIGKSMHDTVHYAYPDATPYPKENCPMYAAFNDGRMHQIHDEVLWNKKGEAIPVRYTSTPIYEGDKIQGAVVTFLDITEEKKAQQELLRQAPRKSRQHLLRLTRF